MQQQTAENTSTPRKTEFIGNCLLSNKLYAEQRTSTCHGHNTTSEVHQGIIYGAGKIGGKL